MGKRALKLTMSVNRRATTERGDTIRLPKLGYLWVAFLTLNLSIVVGAIAQ